MSDGDGFSAFRAIYEAGKGQVLFKRVVADLETPIGTYLKLAEGRRYTFLLESVEGGAVRGRSSRATASSIRSLAASKACRAVMPSRG